MSDGERRSWSFRAGAAAAMVGMVAILALVVDPWVERTLGSRSHRTEAPHRPSVSADARELGRPPSAPESRTPDHWEIETPELPASCKRLSVRIACDEEFRHGDWERIARLRVDQASEVFEKRFGIAWLVKDVTTWNSDDDAPALADLLDQLSRDVSADGVELVLGFTGQTRARGASSYYEKAGHAYTLGRAAIIRIAGAEGAANWRRGALVHELGHVLGAWHSASKSSVMYEGGDRLSSDDFDASSAAMIEMVRDAGFARGVAWIDDARRARISDLYRADHAGDVPLPTVQFALWHGSRALDDPARAAESRRVLAAALREQEECVGSSDESLVTCLMAMSKAWRVGSDADPTEAARLERRATDIVVASNRAHRQNGPRDEPTSTPAKQR